MQRAYARTHARGRADTTRRGPLANEWGTLTTSAAACLVQVVRWWSGTVWLAYRGGGLVVGTVGGGDGTVSRIAHQLPRRRSRRPPDPHRRSVAPIDARCTHARMHVTKRDGLLRTRTTEKCNTESPTARGVLSHTARTHTHRTDDYDRVYYYYYYYVTPSFYTK